LAGRKSLAGDKSFAAQAFVVIRLGGQASSTAGVSLDGGKTTVKTSLQRGLPVGNGLGYSVSASTGPIDRFDAKLSANSNFGTHDAQLSWIDGKTGVRLSTSGGFAIVGGDAFASRRLDQSFATVQVGQYSNVRVYADNQLIGRTDGRGKVVVPRLRPFDRNTLRIELADLPWDAQVNGDERIVRPYRRHGVVVDFGAKPALDGLLRILLADGTPLPAGAIVRVGSSITEFIVAPGGEVYLTGLEPRNVVVASWSAGRCSFEFRFVESLEPQPRLGDFRCGGVQR
jgi:outer membrane usher protein